MLILLLILVNLGLGWPGFCLLAMPPALALDLFFWRRRRSYCLGLLALGLYLAWGLMPWPDKPWPAPLVRVEKGQRRLTFENQHFKIALSRSWRGDKSAMGDGRTPEGKFRICSKEPDGPFGPWLGLDYPQRDRAVAACWDGRLSWLELTRWRWFWRSEPPQSTCLGGQVGLHGGGTLRDWTLGCIALEPKDIDMLYARLPLGAVVEILP